RVPQLSREHPLVLGSASPRRRELLGLVGVPIEVHPADVVEELRSGEDAARYQSRIVASKLEAVLARCPAGRAALVADTEVVLDGQVQGKPTNDAHAAEMLASLA